LRENALTEARTTINIHSNEIRTLEEDLQIWIMAKNIITRLGAAGMSSEDSSLEDGTTYFRVKIVIWRRRMEAILRLIDRQRLLDPTIYTPRGSKGVKRDRIPEGTLESDWQWKSRRLHTDGLPEVLYDPDWLQNILHDRAVVSLNVSREEFDYFEIESLTHHD
jgi:hypothetical protein